MRTRQRGSAMVVMLLILVSLGTIAGLTVISVQGGATAASAQRFSAMALNAAESGAAAAMIWVRTKYSPGAHFWSVLGRTPPPDEVPGNGVAPGQSGNLLSLDQQSWYSVTLYNNATEPDPAKARDEDGIVVIQSTGYGPNGAMRRIELEVLGYKNKGNRALMIISWREVF